jgi:hypothetical protein
MNMPVAVYVCYAIYVIYTGLYLYNRMNGKSAQFFTARISPTDSDGFKVFADAIVLGLFLFGFVSMIYKTMS